MKTFLEMAQSGTAIQNWIEVRLGDIGSDHATRVLGNAKYDGEGALVPTLGYQFRTTLARLGGVAEVILQHAALAFAAPNRAFIFELFRSRCNQLVVQALMVPSGCA